MGRMRDGAATLENIQAPFQSIQQELPFNLNYIYVYSQKNKEGMFAQKLVL